jgi:hypothetical protein
MRRAILLVCLIASPALAQVQIGTMHRSGERFYLSNSGQASVPGYWYDGPLVPRTAASAYEWRVYSPNEQLRMRSFGSSHRPAGYFYYPNYPGLSYSNPQDVRPPQYVLPPTVTTPYHDPFFDEKFWEDLGAGRDVYDYWGW